MFLAYSIKNKDIGCGYRAQINPSLRRGRGQIAHRSYSRHQILSGTLNCLFPCNIPSNDIIFFFQISQPAEIGLKNKYFEEQVHWVPLMMQISLGWDKVNSIHRVCIVQYRIVFSFHLAKRINRPDPGSDRNVRYCPLFGNGLLGVKKIGREQNSR